MKSFPKKFLHDRDFQVTEVRWRDLVFDGSDLHSRSYLLVCKVSPNATMSHYFYDDDFSVNHGRGRQKAVQDGGSSKNFIASSRSQTIRHGKKRKGEEKKGMVSGLRQCIYLV